MVFMLGVAHPSIVHWFSLVKFFSLLIPIRPSYVERPMMWKNAQGGDHVHRFSSGSTVMLALYELGREQVIFGCGFYCSAIDCQIGLYTFSIFILQNQIVNDISINADVEPQVVWSANRDWAVGIDARLELTSEGDLVVEDADGSVAWISRASDKSVLAMSLTNSGNLMLLDEYNATVWQSSDYPTDTLLLGQVLRVGQKLTQMVSSANWTDGGILSLSLTAEGLLAAVESDSTPALAYYSLNFPVTSQSYIEFVNGSLNCLVNAAMEPVMKFAPASSTQSVKLDPDGHLRLYEFQILGAVEKADLFSLDACQYPTVCGYYGVCSNGNCSNIISIDRNKQFKRTDPKHRSRGFFPALLSCVDTNNETFLEITDVNYFNFVADLTDVDVEICKGMCMKNCSCVAVFYRVSPDKSRRWCFLPSEVFTLINDTERNGARINQTTVYIKVPRNSSYISSLPPSTESTLQKKELDSKTDNLRLSLATFVSAATVSAILVVIFVLQKKKKKTTDVSTEKYVEQIPGLPTRFTYTELEEITENFSKKIGEGGFSSVYEGILTDKTKVAVKCIEGFEHTKKTFLTEVKTIGSIHHANLLRLMGFCAKNSYGMLVYEYMSNSSLDNWIFDKSDGYIPLKWDQRRKIILDVAKGLHYLHEECSLKIIHFDIKPQNILLDENLRAKVSDFGMSKLIDRDQSRIMTAMRGTRGYLAPEWLNGAISEKVDVYSFGVVVLEIVCGRKTFGYNDDNGNEYTNLLDLLMKNFEEGCLLEMIDEDIEDADRGDASDMLKIAAWCLQVDSAKRPSMSMVIKVLEGATMVPEDEINYEFKIPSSTSLTMLRLAAQFLPVPEDKVLASLTRYDFIKTSLLMNGTLGILSSTKMVESAEVSGSRPSSEVLSGPR